MALIGDIKLIKMLHPEDEIILTKDSSSSVTGSSVSGKVTQILAIDGYDTCLQLFGSSSSITAGLTAQGNNLKADNSNFNNSWVNLVSITSNPTIISQKYVRFIRLIGSNDLDILSSSGTFQCAVFNQNCGNITTK